MPIQSIKFNNVSFRGEEPNKTKDTSKESKENTNFLDDNGKKVALVLGGLASIGAAVLLIKSGKKVPSELNIEEFRKIGKFDKGVAKVKGKLFTGTIEVPSKDGKHIIEYANGALKQSTGYKNVEIPGVKTFMMPSIKKVYSTAEDGTKTVEKLIYNENYRTFGGKEWATIRTTTVSDGKVVVERINGLTGDKLQDVTVKQQDGNWFKTTQEIDFDSDILAGKRNILTKNAKTGEVLKTETRTFEMSEAGSGKPATEAQKQAFSL